MRETRHAAPSLAASADRAISRMRHILISAAMASGRAPENQSL